MKSYDLPEDELTGHIVNALERRSEQEALEQLRSVDEVELRAAIRRTEPEYRISARSSGVSRIAAIGFVAAMLVLVWMGFQPKYSANELYRSYGPISAYEPIPPSRGEDAGGSADDKIYAFALELIQNDKTPEAIEKLIYLSGCVSFEFQQNAKWELALAYLKIDKRADARRVLIEISEGGGEFSAKAAELLQKIKTRRWF